MEKFTIELPTEENNEPKQKKITKANNSPAAVENSLLPDTIIEDNDEGDHSLGIKLLIIIAVLLIVGLFCMRIFMTYSTSDVRMSYEREDSVESKYLNYLGKLLRYSTDGIFYTGMEGSLIWNYTYDMTNPSAEINGENILVFDKKGNEADFLNKNGLITTVKTQMPIIDGSVSAKNYFAILLQENNVSYVRLYDNYGELVAEGEIHPENGGFPISIAISSDGKRLAIAVINLNAGNINTTIDVYDYSETGKVKANNNIASYSYGNMLMPDISYVKDDKLIAFGDGAIVVFENDEKCSIEKEIYVNDEIKAVFYNREHYGYVYETVNEEGSLVNRMDVYNYYGFKNMSVDLTESYDKVYLMDNNEVVVSDSHIVSIYNQFGVNRFKQRFDPIIYKVMPGTMSSRYYLIEERFTEEISIK